MVRKAIIVVRLLEESVEKTKKELEKMIVDALSEIPPRIPYQEEIETVTVTEET